MSRGYKYRIEVLPVADQDGTHLHTDPLVFTHYNHDNVMLVVERIRKSSRLDPDSAAATAIGLKLLGEVVLQEKGNPLFDCLRNPLREFIRNLKSLSARAHDH